MAKYLRVYDDGHFITQQTCPTTKLGSLVTKPTTTLTMTMTMIGLNSSLSCYDDADLRSFISSYHEIILLDITYLSGGSLEPLASLLPPRVSDDATHTSATM
jgi:uncharacterized membrane protein